MVRVNHLMSTGILSLCFFFLFLSNLCSQTEGDLFMYGNCNDTYEFIPCTDTLFGNSIVRFFGDSILCSPYPYSNGDFLWSKSAIQNGKVEYFSNLVMLFDKNGIVDSNFLDLNLNDLSTYFQYNNRSGSNVLIMLNVKDINREKIYYLYSSVLQSNIWEDSLFAYAELSPVVVPKEQVILNKNNIILTSADSSMRGTAVACRHANGRDWWVFKIGKYHDEFYRGILDFNGIKMEKINTNAPYIKHDVSMGVTSNFNLNGSKFYIFTWGNNINPSENLEDRNFIYVYDFDRCTGELSNLEIHDVTLNTIMFDLFYPCLSPDGTKLYIRKSHELDVNGYVIGEGGIFQYDFITKIFQKIKGSTHGFPILSPNGKWVLVHNMTTPPNGELLGQPSFDIIYNPNEAGLNCNYQENQVILSSFGVGFQPSLANFRLGPVDGSVCDSLGLDAPKEPPVVITKPIVFNVYPNPTNGTLTIDFGNENKHTVGFYNSLGQRVHQFDTSEKLVLLDLTSWGLATGMYFIEIRDLENNQNFNTKIVYYAN